MLRKHAFAMLVVLAAFLLLPAAAKADPIVITLDPTHTVAAGGTATFQGTLVNGGLPGRFVNAVAFTFTGGFANFTFDPNAFFVAVPAFVNPGFTTGALPVNFFDVLVSASATPGTYLGTFGVLGGASDTDNAVLATANFTLIVQGTPSEVPEPATMVLLGTGLAGIVVKVRKRRR